MCEKKLKYSILQYSPSLVSGESINLGVLAASDVEPFVDFIPTKKMTRVAEFDDSLDLDAEAHPSEHKKQGKYYIGKLQ